MADDLTKPSNQVVLDLVNRDNGTELTLLQVAFGVPTPTPEGVKDTQVTLSGLPGSGYKNSVDLTYNRVNLYDDVAVPTGLSLSFEVTGNPTMESVLAAFNSRFTTNLTEGEVVAVVLPAMNEIGVEGHTFTLAAAADSLVYQGQVDLTLTVAEVELQNVVEVTELNGLTYEAPAG